MGSKIFVIHVDIRKREKMLMHSKRQSQIKVLIFYKAPTEVLAEYSNYSNVFLVENAAEFPKNTRINKHAIELEKGKQPLFKPIYSLGPVDLKTLKTYIETNLINGFIWPSISPTGIPILFNRKPNKSFCLCVNYWGLNNILIKNRYPLPLIGKSLDWLGRAKRFTQLDFTNAYHRMRIYEVDE